MSHTAMTVGTVAVQLLIEAVQGPAGPAGELTAGAIAETHAAVLCVHGYAKAHRVWRDKVATLAKYGITPHRASLFEDDDLIPVCLGGNNA